MTITRALLALLLLMACAMRIAAEDPPATEEPKLVACPECDGSGLAKCVAEGCVHGKVPCPKNCLKKTLAWETRQNPSDPKVKRWLKVTGRDGMSVSWLPDTWIGHELVYDALGSPVDGGVCKECNGTGVADCPTCHGTGKAPCELCNGTKQVTEAVAKEWTAKRDAERAAHAIVLKDGTVIYGKVAMRMPDKVMIKTDEGKMVEVAPDQIKSEPPPEPKAPKKPKEAPPAKK